MPVLHQLQPPPPPRALPTLRKQGRPREAEVVEARAANLIAGMLRNKTHLQRLWPMSKSGYEVMAAYRNAALVASINDKLIGVVSHSEASTHDRGRVQHMCYLVQYAGYPVCTVNAGRLQW